jgi:multidrug efflux pump subunit AcrA (membrane-fusion protein)
MKYIKLSKTSWLILAVGLFVVVAAGLGITRSQQAQEQGRLSDELTLSEQSLASIQIAGLAAQLAELQQSADQAQLQLDQAQQSLEQTVISVDITNEFFSIASTCGVTVISLSTSPILPNQYEGIGLTTTSLSAQVQGELSALIDFVESLNTEFTTGVIEAMQIDIPQSDSEETPSINIQMTIYSYEVNDNV